MIAHDISRFLDACALAYRDSILSLNLDRQAKAMPKFGRKVSAVSLTFSVSRTTT